ncbi:MAG: DUF1257 domain-containing protein [Xenococcaceae cyanobacterium MO_188.B32]|nr:DUF1257 domain-containing protein [Xenococcaceae cyanobacterium MO_188.B32]
MFDGLDEVFDLEQRDTVIAQIHDFTEDYPKVKVIVTSRIIGYKPQQLKDAEFNHFMLQDLEPEQIEDFLQKWHNLTYDEATESQKKQDRQQRITKAIKESQAIQQLAVNPLLLTMMAILNRNQDLPRDRAKLYERSSELLLYQWDVEQKLLEDSELKAVDIDHEGKQAMLRDVAHFMQATEKGLAGNLISKRDLKQVLIDYLTTIDINVSQVRKVARLMIDQLRTRNFILCDIGSNYYAFVHRTFLEYFCAWSYIWQFKETQTLSIEDIKTNVFEEHWRDESWHEVLRLIAGMLEPKFVGEIIEYLMEQDGKSVNFANLFLAADCLVEVRNSSALANESKSLLDSFKEILRGDDIAGHIKSKSALLIANNANRFQPDSEVIDLLYQNGYRRELAIISLNNAEALSTLKKCVEPINKPNISYRGDRFSRLRTKIRDDQALISSLQHLNIPVRTNAEVRGGLNNKRADIVAVLQGNCDIGWTRSSDGTFELIADLSGLRKTYNQTELMSMIYIIYSIKSSII